MLFYQAGFSSSESSQFGQQNSPGRPPAGGGGPAQRAFRNGGL